MRSTSLRGRPAATTHAAIEEAGFALFAAQGFEATTLDAIAAEIGVSRRTVTRYYASKNDIPWGQFDRTLDSFRLLLRDTPADLPLWDRVHRGVVAFNDFPANASPPHRERMRLILGTPALQAHAVLRYRQWRSVIAEYVAEQTGTTVEASLPQLVGHVSLALAMQAYERWLAAEPLEPVADRDALLSILDQTLGELRAYLA
ncbi:TetR family transcriptional regulator [Nocardioides sp. BP30]|uniref:acyl-CoA-like ligand-binding transcription factor n=1 Tax=Nocardioides sp. BP30 TaxID=3036374 RepID=UPI002468277E|nr:TetR family transcriptional regulator [Nocardioides sp. BP30]WGL54118.1 TetR family transcriptional regulator [Nocardioides sp. BP30]